MDAHTMHAANMSLCCTCTQMFVLDEADEMLSRGFKDQIYDIFQLLPPKIQVRQSSSEVQCCSTGMWRGSCCSSIKSGPVFGQAAAARSSLQHQERQRQQRRQQAWQLQWHRVDVGLGPRCSSMC